MNLTVNSMKCFITGIKGFGARYLAAELLNQGHLVAGSYRKEEPGELPPQVKGVILDILQADKLKEALLSFRPEWIFHLAGISNISYSWKNPEITHKINVDGTTNLLDACCGLSLDVRILFASSADIYGIPDKIPMKEDNPIHLTSPYSYSKFEAEKLCLSYLKKFNIHTVISRSFPHIGPGQSLGFVTQDFAKQIVDIEKGKTSPIIYVGNLDAERDFTDVRDTMKAYVLLIEKGKKGEIYNISMGKSIKIKNLLDMMLALSKAKILVSVDKNKFRPVEVPILYGDNTKFVQLTHWKPTITIEDSLKDILTYWREQ